MHSYTLAVLLLDVWHCRSVKRALLTSFLGTTVGAVLCSEEFEASWLEM